MICLDVMYSLIKEVGLITPNPPKRGGRNKRFLSVSPNEDLAVRAGMSCFHI